MTGEHEAPTANDLGKVVTSPAARTLIYGAYVTILAADGAATAAFFAVSQALPVWLIATTAVLTYLGIPIGGLAALNTPKKEA